MGTKPPANFGAPLPVTAVVAAEGSEKKLRSCILALKHWVAEVLVLCPKTDAGVEETAREFKCPAIFCGPASVEKLWEKGIKLSATPWRLLIRSNEVTTGQLRNEIHEKVQSPHGGPVSFRLPRATVFLKKRLKYPLQWTGLPPSRLIHIPEGSAVPGLSDLPAGPPLTGGELISYGDEDLHETAVRCLERAERGADKLFDASPDIPAPGLVKLAARSLPAVFFKTYFLKGGIKEGFEGLVFALADQTAALLALLRYHEKYVRSGRQALARIGPLRSVLVVKLRDIGDNILSVPLLKSVKQNLPGVSVSVLAYSYSQAVFENNPHVDKVFGISKNPDAGEIDRMAGTLSARGFDVVMNLHAGGLSAKLVKKIKSPCRINNHYVGRNRHNDVLAEESDYYRSAIERDLDCLRSLGFNPAPSRPELFLTDSEIQWAREHLVRHGFDLDKKIVAVHPTASAEVREWGMERFGQLIERIKTRHPQVLVICSESEYPRVRPLTRNDPRLAVFHQISVRQMMAVVRECDLAIDNDSAISHIATAFGVPALVFFSQAIRQIFRPYDETRDRHKVLYRDVPCRECKLSHCDHKTCLDFPADEAFAVAMQLLEGPPPES
ncbi:MAG: hypothetical protein HY579_06555 [Nitrospinae bacterium]|nr:hypothetical protein [Nitrospinota bacterium]